MDKRFAAYLRQARWAVKRWEAFPVDAVPRPLVLAGPGVISERGFRSGEAKDAWLSGRYEWAPRFPKAFDGERGRVPTQEENRPRLGRSPSQPDAGPAAVVAGRSWRR